MTNVGLQVHFNISAAGTDLSKFNAILDCSPYNTGGEDRGQSCRAEIRLIALGGNQYARLLSDQIFDMSAFSIERRTRSRIQRGLRQPTADSTITDIVFSGLNTIHSFGVYIITG
jgi:hypothetical protein